MSEKVKKRERKGRDGGRRKKKIGGEKRQEKNTKK